MPTKRTRKARFGSNRINPAAVEAFKAQNDDALYDALDLKPWNINPLDAYGECPWPAGCAGNDDWLPAKELRKLLEAAVNED